VTGKQVLKAVFQALLDIGVKAIEIDDLSGWRESGRPFARFNRCDAQSDGRPKQSWICKTSGTIAFTCQTAVSPVTWIDQRSIWIPMSCW
jgi:hypothetical protein